MTTRGYEALIILKAAGTDEEMTRLASQMDAHVKKAGGSVDGSQHFGRRRLAFPISRQVEGHYYLVRFRAPTEQIAELERLFRLNDAIVRFIILTQDEAAPVPQAAAEAVK